MKFEFIWQVVSEEKMFENVDRWNYFKFGQAVSFKKSLWMYNI